MSTYVHIYVYVCILVLQYVAVCCSECLVSGWSDGRILRCQHMCIYMNMCAFLCCSMLQCVAVNVWCRVGPMVGYSDVNICAYI